MEDKTNNKVQDVEFYKQAYEQEKLRAASLAGRLADAKNEADSLQFQLDRIKNRIGNLYSKAILIDSLSCSLIGLRRYSKMPFHMSISCHCIFFTNFSVRICITPFLTQTQILHLKAASDSRLQVF